MYQENKKGFLSVFVTVQIMLLMFVAILALWAVMKEEVVTPLNTELIEYAEQDEHGSMYVENMKNNQLIEIESTIDTIFLLVVIYMAQYTLTSAFITSAKSIFTLLFETVGGLVVVLWFMSSIVVSFIDFFFNEYFFKIFGNVIENTVIIAYFWKYSLFISFLWVLFLYFVNQIIAPAIKRRIYEQ